MSSHLFEVRRVCGGLQRRYPVQKQAARVFAHPGGQLRCRLAAAARAAAVAVAVARQEGAAAGQQGGRPLGGFLGGLLV